MLDPRNTGSNPMAEALRGSQEQIGEDELSLPDWLEGVDLNPKMGDKSGFRKTTATMPEELYQALKLLSARMSIEAGESHSVSSLLRIAAVEMFRSGQWSMPRNWKPYRRKGQR